MFTKPLLKFLVAILGGLMFSSTWASNSWLSMGASHNCSVTNQDRVQCWGNDTNGQLGDGAVGNPTPRPYAAEIAGSLTNVAAVTTGDAHSCALKAEGSVWCWGKNDVGQLGRGNTSAQEATSAKVLYIGPNPNSNETPATQIASGIAHSCALITTGVVVCWGEGSYGQLGNGNSTDSAVPVLVLGIGESNPKAIAIAVGGHHSCALLENNTVRCWGWNLQGQLGTGDISFTPQSFPVEAATLNGRNVISLAAGRIFTCALTAAGEVLCWGHNGNGQIGVPSGTPTASPVSVIDSGVAEIAAGSSHACARMASDNKLKCWGLNTQGQLGIINDTENKFIPTDATRVSWPVRYLAVGGNNTVGSTCARRFIDDVAICWGDNTNGQLGNGNLTVQTGVAEARKSFPVSSQAGALATGYDHTCAIGDFGFFNLSQGIYCWGKNSYGQLGSVSAPEDGTFNVLYGLTNIIAISSQGLTTCAIADPNQSVYCWGGPSSYIKGGSSLTTPIPNFNNVTGLSVGVTHACAIGKYNNNPISGLYCWGQNNHLQLGNTGTDTSTPQPVIVINVNFTAVQTGVNFTCAISDQKRLYCWGRNFNYQLGIINNGTNTATPTMLSSLSNVTAISLGEYHACAVGIKTNTVTLALYCWGGGNSSGVPNFDYGQLGSNPLLNGSLNAINGLTNITAITSAKYHTCAVANPNKSVYCFGGGSGYNFGQVGPNAQLGGSLNMLSGLSNFTTVAANTYHTCAVQQLTGAQAALYCWGGGQNQNYGQLGQDAQTDGTLNLQMGKPTHPLYYVSDSWRLSNDALFKGWFEPAQ